jgi:phosphoribosylaminoimidazolecarboxamide formyltransferase/IMP cyclohydrolase
MPRRAIIGPYDKTGAEGLARGLVALGWEVYSTGRTHQLLQDAGVLVRKVEDLTGFPEILDGRVKTLHPAVHGGLLARRDLPEHIAALQEHGMAPIDLVACNLYPFYKTVTEGEPDLETALENIDIGGPTMLRAGAKNFPHVLALVDPADYQATLAALASGEVSLEERKRLAYKAFQHVAAYDSAIAEYLRPDGAFPQTLTLAFDKLDDLRYGENPHQQGAVYRDRSLAEFASSGVAGAELLHGKAMSYVNYVDADGAWRAAWDFDEPACVIVKHATPCGAAVHQDILKAYELALAGDPVSAYGGILAFNVDVGAELGTAIRELRNPLSGMRQLYDVMIAPNYSEEALEILRGKSKDLRLLRAQPPRKGGWRYRQISGGLLVHDDDTFSGEEFEFKTVTSREPTADERADLAFAWRLCKHVKSNAIVFARGQSVVGQGAGQTNRVNSVWLAARQAGERAKGAVMASDAFFPFPDGVEEAAQAGITAVAQPGGSIRDDDVVAAADRLGLAMVLTGRRHFRH